MGKSPNTVTTSNTTTPNPTALAAYQNVVGKAQGVASTPYTPYTGELTAGLNGGQTQSIGQLQGLYGSATPFMNTASGYLNNASAGLGAVQPYLQAGSQAVASGQGYASQAAALSNPNANAQYMNPYEQQVIDATMATAHQNDAIQQQGLASNAIGSGAYGGDRAGVASSVLSGQQQLADNQTVAGLNAANYQQATAARQADAGIYGNLANSANQAAGLYGSLGQAQGQVAQGYGSLGQTAAGLGTAAQNALIQGASAGLQGSTLQQQTQQAADTSAYGQYQNALSYPYSQTGWLSNIVQGVGSSEGSSGTSTSPGPSTLSQVVGAGTTGLGILSATGGLGANGWLSSLFADGGRVGYKRGGLVGDVIDLNRGADGVYREGRATGGLVPRPAFDVGGGLNVDPNSLTAPSAGLIGGNVAPLQTGGARMIQPPAPYNPQQSQGGLGVLSGAPQGGSSGGLNPNTSQPQSGPSNGSMAIIAAGLGMMGGSSPFAMTNIGQGGLAGLSEYNRLQQQDRQNSLAQSEASVRQGQLGLENRKENFAESQAQRMYDTMRTAAGVASGQDPNASTPPPIASPQAGGLVPQVGVPPSGGSASVAPGLVPSSVTSPSNPINIAPTAQPASGLVPAASSASSSNDFWSNVNPQSNPTVLNNMAARFDRASQVAAAGGSEQMASTYSQRAGALRQQAQGIADKGVVLMNDGTMQQIPGSNDIAAAKASADAQGKAQGEQTGKNQTVYDPDGNPITVPGSVYQDIVRKGGGSLDGLPVSASQSQYAGVNVDNYKEFSKDAVKFQSDYQQNRYSLNALNQIYQKYQSGRGAEAVADLDGLIKQMPGNVASLVPDKWQNSQAGFDSAIKGATDQAFKNLADSGAQRAPAAGLRESLMTSARPDADPVAVQKILSDKLAALDYSHDLYNSVVNGPNHNVTQGIQAFQQNSKYSDYVNAARGAMPAGKGVTPSSSSMVLGSPGGQMPAAEQKSVNSPTVGDLMSQARDAIARGAPRAAVMKRLQSQYNISGAGL